MADRIDLDGVAIIVGAGQAGAELSVRLRQSGFRGRIALIGQEPHLPYNRPPLSKAFLAGEITRDELVTKSAAAYEKNGVELHLGTCVEHIDRVRQDVALSDGVHLHYDVLVLATGGRPRRLEVPGATLGRLFYLRTIEDVEAIRHALRPGLRLVIVGGGYVGLEVAAACVGTGVDVTVLEGAHRVLARVTAPAMSAFYESHHASHGVRILTNVVVSGFTPSDVDPGVVGAVECGPDLSLAADIVVVGIGLIANSELATNAGLVVDGGILVSPDHLTADPRIYAIGDCATHRRHGFLERQIRLESVPNALEQARACAAHICGKPMPAPAPPWFWSDQYALKLQMVGLSQGFDETVLRGSVERGSFMTFYLDHGRMIAADAVNRPADFLVAKRMVAARLAPPAGSLADETVALGALL